MKKGSYWFAFLSEKEQKEFRENAQPSKKFYELMEESFEDFEDFIIQSFEWSKTNEGYDYWFDIFDVATSTPIIHNHFHIVYMTGENKCTGVNIEAVDMIDALKQFKSRNNGVKPIYCYAK